MKARFIRAALPLLLCLSLLFLPACRAERLREEYTAFCRAGREGEISFVLNGEPYTAVFCIAEGDGSAAARGASMTFSTPLALAGITVTAEEDGLCLSLDGVRHTLPATALPAIFPLFFFFEGRVGEEGEADGEGGLSLSREEGEYQIKQSEAGAWVLSFRSARLTLCLEIGEKE